MTNFITVAVLVCQVGISNKLQCFDKGSENLRDTEISKSVDLSFYKCRDKYFKDCDLETKWDGCKFTMKNASVVYSSFTCP